MDLEQLNNVLYALVLDGSRDTIISVEFNSIRVVETHGDFSSIESQNRIKSDIDCFNLTRYDLFSIKKFFVLTFSLEIVLVCEEKI